MATNLLRPVAANDHRAVQPNRRYSITFEVSGAALNTNLAGIRKLSANSLVSVRRMEVAMYHTSATGATGVPISFWRATNVAGGTLITAADLPDHEAAAPNPTLEVRTGAVTGTKANQRLWVAGMAGTVATQTGFGGYVWPTHDEANHFVFSGDEGIIVDQSPIASGVNVRYLITITWEEEP